MKWNILIILITTFLMISLVGALTLEQQLIRDEALFGNATMPPSSYTHQITSTKNTGDWKVIKSGKEAIWVRDVTISKDGFVTIYANTLADRTIEVCSLTDEKEVCRNEVIDIPLTLDVRKENSLSVDETISKNQFSDRYTYQLPDLKINYKLGDNSIHIIADIVSVATTQNVICEGNACRLNLSDFPPYDRLLGYFPFDIDDGITAFDYTHNNLDGTYNGDTFVNSTCDSGFSSCAKFPSGTPFINYITLGDTGFLLNASANGLTFTSWVKSKNSFGFLGNRHHCIVCQSYMQFGTPTSDMEGAGIVQQDPDLNTTYISSYWTEAGVEKSIVAIGDTKLNKDQWYMITGTANQSHSCIYVNGVLDGSCILVPSTYDFKVQKEGRYFIGSNPDVFAGQMNWNGSLDEVMIFNISLTPTQIQDIYNNQSARFKPTGTLSISQYHINLTSANDDSIVNISSELIRLLDSNVSAKVCSNGLCGNDLNFFGSKKNTTLTTGAWGNVTANLTLKSGTSQFYTPLINGSFLLDYSEFGGGNITVCRVLDIENENYKLLNDLSATTSCLIVENNNITIDMNGKNITGDKGSNDIGINIEGWNETIVTGGEIIDMGNGISSSSNTKTLFTNLNISFNDLSTTQDFIAIGIRLSLSNNNTISNINTSIILFGFQQGGTSIGVSLLSSNNNLITNSSFSNSGGDFGEGIMLSRSHNNTISNIKANDNNGLGINIVISSNDNLFKDSNFSLNPTDVQISASLNNTFLNVSFDSENVISSSELIRKWYVNVFVNNTLGRFLRANVTAYNSSGQAQFSEFTDASTGNMPQKTATQYINFDGTTNNFEPYLINVSHPRHQNFSNVTGLTFNKWFRFTLDPLPSTCGIFQNQIFEDEEFTFPVLLSTDGKLRRIINERVTDVQSPYNRLCFGARFI